MDENEIEYLSTIPDQKTVRTISSLFTPVNKDCRGYTNCFKCAKCGANIYTADYSKACEFNFCPYCGEAD